MTKQIILYSNKSDRKCIVKDLEEIVNITESFHIKKPCSILKPVILLSRYTIGPRWADVNYVYIPDFKRYYFVDNLTISGAGVHGASTPKEKAKGGFVLLELSVDVLQTYQQQIMNQQQEVVRSEYLNSKLYVDNELPLLANKELTYNTLGLFPEASGNNYLLTTAGGAS